MTKKIITFKNEDSYNTFTKNRMLECFKNMIDNMEEDGKTYIVTMEEVEEIEII